MDSQLKRKMEFIVGYLTENKLEDLKNELGSFKFTEEDLVLIVDSFPEKYKSKIIFEKFPFVEKTYFVVKQNSFTEEVYSFKVYSQNNIVLYNKDNKQIFTFRNRMRFLEFLRTQYKSYEDEISSKTLYDAIVNAVYYAKFVFDSSSLNMFTENLLKNGSDNEKEKENDIPQ
jgi:hypothetical protein